MRELNRDINRILKIEIKDTQITFNMDGNVINTVHVDDINGFFKVFDGILLDLIPDLMLTTYDSYNAYCTESYCRHTLHCKNTDNKNVYSKEYTFDYSTKLISLSFFKNFNPYTQFKIRIYANDDYFLRIFNNVSSIISALQLAFVTS